MGARLKADGAAASCGRQSQAQRNEHLNDRLKKDFLLSQIIELITQTTGKSIKVIFRVNHLLGEAITFTRPTYQKPSYTTAMLYMILTFSGSH
jgi:hypothetical protein